MAEKVVEVESQPQLVRQVFNSIIIKYTHTHTNMLIAGYKSRDAAELFDKLSNTNNMRSTRTPLSFSLYALPLSFSFYAINTLHGHNLIFIFVFINKS